MSAPFYTVSGLVSEGPRSQARMRGNSYNVNLFVKCFNEIIKNEKTMIISLYFLVYLRISMVKIVFIIWFLAFFLVLTTFVWLQARFKY